ncbi:MAG: hypothetical protein HKO99_08130 [Xanthomonadales bacterium]|nr:hypothetical protein [Gammaproteobacteria bacterium]MBT8052325.1 hypothetical protein [Gammaproteobacteria bacterium]NNK51549.1 hypothetical protein [Xanthomonadales bacterium]
MKFRRWQTLSKGRTLILDITNIAQKMPMAPLLREFDLERIGQLRSQFRPRISWVVLFLKAYGIVSERNSILRQIYAPLPFPHIYTHPQNVALVTISRVVDGEPRLYFARFHRPEERSLEELQKQYEECRRAPIDQLRQFKRQDLLSSMPWFVRKSVWFLLTHLWPSKRAANIGTFGLSLSGFNGNLGTFHLGPNTTILGCELFPRKGRNRVTLTFDHRILDGKPAADALDDLQRAFANEITEELEAMIARAEK